MEAVSFHDAEKEPQNMRDADRLGLVLDSQLDALGFGVERAIFAPHITSLVGRRGRGGRVENPSKSRIGLGAHAQVDIS
jgi:hypothetical protein